MEEEKAVNTMESAPVETEVKQEADVTSEQPQEETTTETTTQSSTPPVVGQPQVDLYDERGVPWKNVALENKRKVEELAEKIPDLIQQGFQQYGQGQAKQEWSISQLEAYALDNPEYRPWVEEEKAKVIRGQLTKELDEKLQTNQRRQEGEVKRQNALRYVMDNYSDAFVKNQQGQIVGWNNNHPLTQQIGLLMQDKRAIDDPDGLAIVADVAYARYMRQQQGVSKAKEKTLKQEVKSLQKKTMIEGGGKPTPQAIPPHRAAIEKVKKTGSIKDAAEAVGLIFERHRASQTQE